MHMNTKSRTILVFCVIFIITHHPEKGTAALDRPGRTWLWCCATAGFQDRFGKLQNTKDRVVKQLKAQLCLTRRKCRKYSCHYLKGIQVTEELLFWQIVLLVFFCGIQPTAVEQLVQIPRMKKACRYERICAKLLQAFIEEVL